MFEYQLLSDNDNYRASIQSVKDAIENEGFDYAFIYYSEFKEVKNREFHRLRQQFVEARLQLEKFLYEDEE